MNKSDDLFRNRLRQLDAKQTDAIRRTDDLVASVTLRLSRKRAIRRCVRTGAAACFVAIVGFALVHDGGKHIKTADGTQKIDRPPPNTETAQLGPRGEAVLKYEIAAFNSASLS